MKFKSFVDRGGKTEDGFYTPTTVGTLLIAENEADEVILKRIIEMEERREEAWIEYCVKGLYKNKEE